jgi:hypothetical protein
MAGPDCEAEEAKFRPTTAEKLAAQVEVVE